MAAETTPLAKRILDLKEAQANSVRLRAQAEASLQQAERNLANIDARLKELGINPENAEQELAALESQLSVTVTELTASITEEVKRYNEILAVTRNAGG